MAISPATLHAMIDAELDTLRDPRIVTAIRALQVEPQMRWMDWDYGPDDQQNACWTVLDDPESTTAIVYCEQGFGPRSPWGLVWSERDGARRSMGMDSSWFTSFLAAYLESSPAATLHIWRVFATTADRTSHPITDEMESTAAWQRRDELAALDLSSRYDVRPSTSAKPPA